MVIIKNCTVVDNLTGEIIDDNFQIQELNDIQNAKNAIDYRKSEEEFKRFIDENLGNFYFLFYKLIKKGIERQYIMRFLYLCTYMNYNNKLYIKTLNRYMVEDDLQNILKLSEREVFRTKKVLLDNNFIEIKNNKTIHINKKYCLKGKIEGNKNKSIKVRIFENGIKELYEKSKSREHKKLTLLIELLPYINLKYNIVCSNPECELMEDITPIKLSDLAKKLHFSSIQKMKKGLFDVTVNEEKVIGVFSINNKSSMILINPRIYYKGSQIVDIEYLMGLFDMSKNI